MLFLLCASLAARDGRSDSDARHLSLFRDLILNRMYNYHAGLEDGSKWPPNAEALSMAGQRRLDHFSAMVAAAVESDVTGHVIETGVWRGGSSFMAAKTLELLGPRAQGRRTYLADSFRGIPSTDRSRVKAIEQQARVKAARGMVGVFEWIWPFGKPAVDPITIDMTAQDLEILNDNSAARVREDAARLRLDASRLRFVVGYFNESLPKLLQSKPDLTFAVVRLDGDTFLSTYDALDQLYPRLSPGGFLIVDDYLGWSSCRHAIDTYRREHGITERIVAVPHKQGEAWGGVYWRKHDPQRKEQLPVCVGAPPGSLRPADGLYAPPRPYSKLDAAAHTISGVAGLAKCVPRMPTA